MEVYYRAKLPSMKKIQSGGKLDGMITAGLSSQICDGAAAILICNDNRLAPGKKLVIFHSYGLVQRLFRWH